MPGTSGACVMSSCWSSAGVMGDQRAVAGCPAPAARGTLISLAGISGGDGLLGVAAGDLDAAGLGVLVDRDGQGEDAGGVVGGDLVRVEGLAEEDLPGVGAVGPLGDEQLDPVGLHRGALGADGEHV